MDGIIENIKNPEINQNTVLKIFKEKGCYNGFAWLGIKEIVGVDETQELYPHVSVNYYLVIYKHLFTEQIFGTPVRVSKSPTGIGYSTLIEKTTNLTDLK